jgi:anti-anti-sigma factor
MGADQKARLILDRDQRAARIVFEAACDVAIVEEAEKLLREAADADVRRLELDFEKVPFADTTAVRLALLARDHIAAIGGQLIVKAPPPVRRVFDLTRTADRFEILPAP